MSATKFEELSFIELAVLSTDLPTLPGWGELDAKTKAQERELFGKGCRSWSDEEIAIIFNYRLTHEEKMQKLTALRQAMAAKRAARKRTATAPKTFDQPIVSIDAIRAKRLGHQFGLRTVLSTHRSSARGAGSRMIVARTTLRRHLNPEAQIRRSRGLGVTSELPTNQTLLTLARL